MAILIKAPAPTAKAEPTEEGKLSLDDALAPRLASRSGESSSPLRALIGLAELG